MRRVWSCREKTLHKLGSNEVWELQLQHKKNDPVIVGFVQLFPNGSTCYWFKPGEVGKLGPSYGSRCDQACRGLMEAFSIVEKTVAAMPQPVFIPDNPPEKNYTCPGCNKPVHGKRVGESCTYIIEHVQKNECKYKGPVP